MLIRRVSAVLLIACGLLLVTATMWGRQAGAAASAGAVQVGAYDDGMPTLGNDEPLAPFSFAVIGPVRGDHAALGRALAALDQYGEVRSVVLLGDVLDDAIPADHSSVLPLVVTLRSSDLPVVAVAGSGDLRRLSEFQRFICAPDWSFRDSGCLFTSWGPDSSGSIERVPADDVAVRFLFTTSPPPPSELPWAEVFVAARDASDLRVEVVHVTANADVLRESFQVSRGRSPRSAFTDLAIGVLYPLSGTTTGLVTFLLIAGACVFGAFRLLRPSSQVSVSQPPTRLTEYPRRSSSATSVSR